MNYTLKTLFTLFIIINSHFGYSQNRVQISGIISDIITNESLIGANIFDTITKRGVVSDKNGYFNFIVNAPTVLRISFVGYNNAYLNVNHYIDTLYMVKLTGGAQLAGVEITAEQIIDFNVSKLTSKDFLQTPSLGGKPDVIKTMQLLPGISSQNEGSSLLLVRGGDPGQNLYLFDNVPLIYVNHLGGFFSVFNPDIINEVSIYKGGFPARYGGKLSSIVDVKQKDGDISGLKSSIGIGITDVSFSLEGPTKLKNSSFIIAGRKTLIDPIMALASKLSEGNSFIIMYGFHDINGKYTWKPDDKNTISLCLYQGDDYLNYWSDSKKTLSSGKYRFNNTWGNWMTSLNWNRVYSNKLFGNNGISYTKYRLKEKISYSLNDAQDTVSYENKFSSSVSNYSLFSNWKYSIRNNWVAEFGIISSLLINKPNTYTSSSNSYSYVENTILSNETRFYIDNKFKILKRTNISIGLNIANYLNNDFVDFSFEPRVNINIGINSKNLLNLSYMKATQYNHLLFTKGNIMNNEIWIPASNSIPPSTSNQFSIGWSSSVVKNKIYIECNAFVKTMNNLVTYKEGYTSIKGDVNWLSKIEKNGTGMSKGFEFQLKKNYGLLTGFISYTFSNTTRNYTNINNDKTYIFEYDRPHSISFVSNYKLNKKISINIAWLYQTGLPYTPVEGKQLVPSLTLDENGNSFYYEAIIYGNRNSKRMKDYHRLDISINYEKITKKGNRAIWTFSVYNLYNRQNPYYYYYNTNSSSEITMPETGANHDQVALYQISFFPIIPSVSYKLFFDYKAKKNNVKTSIKEKIVKWLKYEKK